MKEANVDTMVARSATFSLPVVVDEVAPRNLCCDVAVDAGLQVYMARAKVRALKILDPYPVDIVVTDLQIPQLGGLGLLQPTRANRDESAVMPSRAVERLETIAGLAVGLRETVRRLFHAWGERHEPAGHV
jgi:DNA-binding response OmpR family regulator